jgi:hypothetical protein
VSQQSVVQRRTDPATLGRRTYGEPRESERAIEPSKAIVADRICQSLRPAVSRVLVEEHVAVGEPDHSTFVIVRAAEMEARLVRLGGKRRCHLFGRVFDADDRSRECLPMDVADSSDQGVVDPIGIDGCVRDTHEASFDRADARVSRDAEIVKSLYYI